MLKIAVAGCGRLARQVHLPVLARLPDVEVVAVVDPDANSRELALKTCPRASGLARLSEVWEACDVDAAVISAPPFAHADLATEALRRGKHIYLEKPLAGNLEDGDRILAGWKRAGQVAMVGFNYRFNRLFESARRALAEGTIGKPLMVSTVFSSSMNLSGDWRGERCSGGGVLLELGSHHVDLMHFLFGERVVAASAQSFATHAAMQMKLESGLLVSSAFSFGTVDQDRVEIFGDRALLRVDRYLSTECEIIPVHGQQKRLRQLAAALSFVRRPWEILEKSRVPGQELSYGAALQAFVEASRTGTPRTPDLDDGYRALEVLVAAERCAMSDSRVTVA